MLLVNRRREVDAMLEDGEKPADCKHCQGGGESSEHQQQRYWDIPLDADLLETIVKIYPDWFKDGDDDKSKESLKVKLMLRRPPLNQRSDQGILPPLKSPPAFHEQIQKLERTKMGDILKHKFQKKPERQELIHHILEDHPEERGLKKARLSEDHLHPEEILAQAVRDTCMLKSGFEEDSGGSDGAFSPSPPYDFSEHSQSSMPSLEALSPASSPACLPPDHVTEYLVLHHPPAPKNRKKAKPKPQQPKTKQMKFHEYKGPPSAQKQQQPCSLGASEVPLNAQQQQLLIQLQMECEQQQTNRPPAPLQQVQRPPPQDQPPLQQVPPPAPPQPTPPPPPQQLFEAPPASPQKLLLSNFEDLKVTDLKAELKKKGLPVSGSKPQLIQRLRSHVPPEDDDAIANDHIVQLQQIWIETLTREVERSREQLRECQLPMPSPPPPPKQPDNKKQIIQQLLQQKIQQQELQKRQQGGSNSTLTALLESGPLNAPPLPLEEEFPPSCEPLPKTDLPTPPLSTRSSSLPSFAVIRPSKPSPTRSNTDPQFTRLPPDYSEATRHLKVKQLASDGNPRHSKKHKSVKSQAVDDVLDILISSGELSPSAAHEPVTPPKDPLSSLFPKELFPPSSSAPKEVPDHLQSLQSVLDLTPPPSTGFGGAPLPDCFDFPIDLDLEGLDSLQLRRPDDQQLLITQQQLGMDERSRGMDDSGIIEWLEEYEESSGAFTPSFDSSDPLMLHGHEALGFFAADDLDFKPPSNSDFLLTPWSSEHAT